ncbi:MAG: hypothetical protein V7700_10275 [Halioglobus sp.]
MGHNSRESAGTDTVDDIFEPGLGDLTDDSFEDITPISSEKQRLAAKRRRAEHRLEERRLRDELGDYDLQLDDF